MYYYDYVGTKCNSNKLKPHNVKTGHAITSIFAILKRNILPLPVWSDKLIVKHRLHVSI